MSFIERLLPSQGLYCVAMALSQGFRHFFFSDIEDVERQISMLEKRGSTVYLAQGSYSQAAADAVQHNNNLPTGLSQAERKAQRRGERTHDNVVFLRNFFFDIDCGPDKDYPSQAEGAAALGKFVKECGLPIPAVVNSGNGLYAHWLMDEDIPAQSWRTVAFILKDLADKAGFKADPARTSDPSSVLRPVGTTNRKPGKAERPVRVVREAQPVPFKDFVLAVKAAADKHLVQTRAISAPKEDDEAVAAYYSGTEASGPPASAEIVAQKCLQMQAFKAAEGNVSEPYWYASLGILCFCEDGDDLATEWSSGHPDFSAEGTALKMDQWRASGAGPTTCVKYASVNHGGCMGCAHIGRIKSPILLGRKAPEALPVETDEASDEPICDPAPPFRRAADGLYVEQDGVWFKFFDCDLYPVRLSRDEGLGYQTAIIRHHLPHEGAMEFSIRSSVVGDPKTLLSVLWDNHVSIIGSREKKLMAQYLESYMHRLQRNRKMTQLMCQMGWGKSGGESIFVLGDRIIQADGAEQPATLAKTVPAAVESIHPSGSLAEWSAAANILNQPGLEPYAFALLAGGFGAPLLKFTGFDGAMVSLVGDTGVGKTLMLRLICSVWGHHKNLILLRDDTRNMLISRLGTMGSLPVVIDEVTNIDGQDLSDMVYRITQGRDKGRLTKASEERKTLNSWSTIATVSSNASMVERLCTAKGDVGAEISRIFEYYVPRRPELTQDVTTALYWALDNNYGLAGLEYAKWLLAHEGILAEQLAKVKAILDERAGALPEERFWSAMIAVAIYGGIVAKKLGLIQFDIARIQNWAVMTMMRQRAEKAAVGVSAVEVLAQFLAYYAGNILVVDVTGPRTYYIHNADRLPQRVVGRYEANLGKLFIPRGLFRDWVLRSKMSYNKIRDELITGGPLRDDRIKKTIGAGTDRAPGQQQCLELDVTHPSMGMAVEELKKRPAIMPSPTNPEARPWLQ